jgi:UDP-N-acetylmuramate--alanine ligase
VFKKIRQIHFVGIGGIGMSGIAEVLHNLGYGVSGSDSKASETTRRLGALGLAVTIGHRAENVGTADVVVRSSAVTPENPEIVVARQRLVPVIQRAEMLAELMRMKYGVSNAKLGRGDFLVAEADESDGSFLKLSPTIAVVTTIDAEHLDYYRDLAHIQDVFVQFINKVPFYGLAVLCLDQENIQAILPQVEKRYVTYGLRTQADFLARDITFAGMTSACRVLWKGKPLGRLALKVPGLHNIYNALAAVAVGMDLDLPFEVIRDALGEFSGVDRRFQIRGEARGVTVVDDYAHHPAEIQATLNAAKDGFGRQVVAVFQPHRYTRTQALLSDFSTAFYQADRVFVTEIYPAGELPIPGVSGRQIAEGAAGHGHRGVTFVADKGALASEVLRVVQSGDMVLTMGAGDVWRVGEEILERLRETDR